jgi:pimeloyl-ACP methyl ester carboxylesterase
VPSPQPTATTIGFRRYGAGPGLLLIHGGMNAAQDLADLASLLSDAFTVIVPDRRGRGVSGPFGPDHTIAKEVDDVRAVLDRTGARFVFGLSAGAVVALEAAAELPQIRRLAVYEPPLTASADSASWNWIARYDREVAAGQLGAALVTVAAGTGDTSIVTRLPRFLAEPFLNFAINAQAKQVKRMRCRSRSWCSPCTTTRRWCEPWRVGSTVLTGSAGRCC